MKPNEGRLQTVEHILLRILKDRFGVVAGISKFKEESSFLEVISPVDMRTIDKDELEKKINDVIKQNLDVNTYVIRREEATELADLSKLPSSIKVVTIVDIENFDRSPCRDHHVTNTREIGRFKITSIERVGKERYRFTFEVE